MSKQRLNHKRRKKMRRKIKRQDIGWEKVLAELTISEIKTDRHLSVHKHKQKEVGYAYQFRRRRI